MGGASLLATSLGLSALALVLAAWFGYAHQRNETATLVAKLADGRTTRSTGAVSFDEFKNLPAPVERYFRRVLKEGQPHIRLARIRQEGVLHTTEHAKRWTPFEASQVVASPAPGFVWDARVRVAPFVHVRVRDSYVAGQGAGTVSLLSTVTVAHDTGRAELNSAALHRYLAEAVWYPTALLPEAGVQWSPLDNDRAVATLTDSSTTVSLEFRFGKEGEAKGIFAPERYGLFNGKYELAPWEGSFRNYAEKQGMWVPTEGEVRWRLPDRWWSFWKGAIVAVDYSFERSS